MEHGISRRSLADEVAARLQQQIKSGQYKVGDQLPVEPELMHRFGVGRSSIREAIKLLVNSGLLRVQQGVGMFVEEHAGICEPLSQRLKRSDMNDIKEVRQLLEMKIAEKAAVHRTAKDAKKIQRCFEAREKAAAANDIAGSVEADISFHNAIAEASGNEVLADLYKSFSSRIGNDFLSRFSDTRPFIDTMDLHRQLLKSIIDKDPKGAWHFAARINGHVSA
ncbi:FadR family transcriptional regulator [Paraflavitalea soli]|uniref:FadR family transcriptional regulator n=1 Tax=Paraflavitalea soli TaxID=2315862 RepID=A0A3B7MH95_9BACT|nr:FadR/GntR family transcriptional regulator [Paraflavitalea soli]AXY72957.1 FadR family transcriptional regulator [Paraflavitalea soli]